MSIRATTEPVGADGAGAEPSGEGAPRDWPRLLAVCIAITGVVFVQDPGRIATDTKLDLTVDPWGFLARSLHLWEPEGFFGQVQNQAYGYLFPMGPFFGVGDLVQAPDWVVQRLWWSVLLCAAFVGVERLAAALQIGGRGTRLVAAAAFALSPRMLTVLGPSSVEVLPMAVAPWVLLPLVVGSIHGSPRRAAALSGLAVAFLGGVNAVASLAALVPAGLFLLTRAPGPRSRRLTGWWVLAVALATAWWVVPLLLLGRYSPPFLDWIESASVTTSITSVAASLRGVSAWVAYLPSPTGPDLLAGWQLLTVSAVVLHTMLVVAVGLFGLALPGLRERVWLLGCLLLGLVLVTAGHVGPVDGGLAEPMRAALDGVLAPFRNTHKFDVVMRLPLALGVAHGLAWVVRALGRRDVTGRRLTPGVVRASAIGVLVVVGLGSVAPLLTNRLVPRGSYLEVPSYWEEAADWLADQDDSRALLVPGSSFGTYVWGRTRDEPLQPLARAPWVVRDAVPLTPAGTIRALDAVQQRLATGTGSPGLAPFLARMGISHLVVRNDLDPVAAASPPSPLVHQALDTSPGLVRVASFGPDFGGGSTPELRNEGGLDLAYPAVEIWSVARAQPAVAVVPERDRLVVVGGPESLLDLSDRGLEPSRPVVLTGDLPEGSTLAGAAVTDGMRLRETNYGRVDDHSSFTLSLQDPLRRSAASRDYLPFEGWDTVARWFGVDSVDVSSSAGDANAPFGTQPAHQPFAAVDGDLRTFWKSSGVGGAVGQWVEVAFRGLTTPTGVTLTLADDGAGTVPSRVVVTTDAGSVEQRVSQGRPQDLSVPAGPTRTLRVTLTETSSTPPGFAFAIAELAVQGMQATRSLVTPGAGAAAFLTTADGGRRGCVADQGDWLCPPGLSRDGEEVAGLDRVVRLAPGQEYRIASTVLPRPGPALDALLDSSYPGVRVRASSAGVADPAARPQTVVDGSMGTGWAAAAGDESPELVVQIGERRSITGVRLRVDDRLPASAPTSVVIDAGADGRREGVLAADGRLEFPALLTDRFRVWFPTVRTIQSYDRRFGVWTVLPVGLSELEVVGAEDLLAPSPAGDAIVVPCSEGPVLRLAGTQVRLALTTSVADVMAGGPISAVPCGPGASMRLPGQVRVQLGSDDRWLARSVDLTSASVEITAPAATGQPEVRVWDAASRVVAVAARTESSLLVVRENTNPGWVATWEGEQLEPVVVDGWQQGWRLPAGAAGEVQLDYLPDRTYRAALAGGVLALLLLAGLAGWRGSRRDPAVGPARVPTGVVAVGTAALLWLAAGWTGPLALVAGLLVLRVVPVRRRLAVGAVAAAAAAAAAAVLLARGPWASGDYAGDAAAPQLAGVAALVLVAASVVHGSRRQRPQRHP